MRLAIGSSLLLIAAAMVLSNPQAADAHALLLRSDPRQGARLQDQPGRVTAWFSEPLEPGISSLRVVDASGGRVDDGPTAFDPSDSTRMSVAVRSDLGPGFYLVIWETLSRIDGHIRFGSFDFAILNADGSEPSGPHPVPVSGSAGSPGTEAESALTKFAGLAAVAALIGSIAFVLFVAGPASRQLPGLQRSRAFDEAARRLPWFAWPSVGMLAAVAAAELLLQARQIGGTDGIGRVLDTSWGERWIQRQLILLALVASVSLLQWTFRSGQRRAFTVGLWSALLAGFGYLLLVSLVSHANAVLKGSFWAVTSDFVHLLAAAIWTGGLVQLVLLLAWGRRGLGDDVRPILLAATVRRFSLVAATSLIALLATGVFNALVHVSPVDAMVETAYGRALTLKLALLLPLLAVAGLNGLVLRPRLVKEASATGEGVERLRTSLSRMAGLEAALALAVLAVVGVLVQYTPARVEIAAVAAATSPAGLEPVQGRGAFVYPLVAGSWIGVAAVGMMVGALLIWVWSAYLGDLSKRVSRAARALGFALAPVGVVLLIAVSVLGPSGAGEFKAQVALRYQAPDGRLALLEIDPFQVGSNEFRVTVMNERGEPAKADSVDLRFSGLELAGELDRISTTPAQDGSPYLAHYDLPQPGWWAIDVVIDGSEAVSFYTRLDQPSRAPLDFAPADYASDPAAEALFGRTFERYQGLSSVKMREELTSGLLAPTGIGAWVVTEGVVEAPDRLHLRVLSPGSSHYELYRVGEESCSRDLGGSAPWQCSTSESSGTFDIDYLEPSTAFRLGRREIVDSEMSQVLLFYNPAQGAWYAWWIGEETGHLRRQAMVAPGHFMLTRFYDHDVPIGIVIPDEAVVSGT